MPARRIKSLYGVPGQRAHREHRSKRGRVAGWKREKNKQWRLRKLQSAEARSWNQLQRELKRL